MLHNPTKRSFTFGPNEALSRNKTMRLQAKANNILLSGFGSRHLLLIIPHLCFNLSPSIIFLFFYSSFSHHPFHKFSITPCEPLSQSFHVFPTTIKTLSLSLFNFLLFVYECFIVPPIFAMDFILFLLDLFWVELFQCFWKLYLGLILLCVEPKV